jgi:DNA polymerase III gamma/tau subunit
MELYKKHRPTKLSQMVGQEAAVNQLRGMIKKKTVPHTIMFTGPSGCGKTTLARILARMLKIDPYDIQEINAANSKGIDMVREITATLNMRPLNGPARMFIIDEAQQLTAAAQDSFLKPLEDTPAHVYFVICTTDRGKIKATIKTRCTEIPVKLLALHDLDELINSTCEAEGIELDGEVKAKIGQVAEGSARKAMVLLHQIKEIEDTEEQMNCLTKKDAEAVGIDLCRALINPKSKWQDVAKILKAMEQDAESVRRQVLGYASAVLINSGQQRAALILEAFESNLFDSGKPGLVLQAFNCYSAK